MDWEFIVSRLVSAKEKLKSRIDNLQETNRALEEDNRTLLELNATLRAQLKEEKEKVQAFYKFVEAIEEIGASKNLETAGISQTATAIEPDPDMGNSIQNPQAKDPGEVLCEDQSIPEVPVLDDKKEGFHFKFNIFG